MTMQTEPLFNIVERGKKEWESTVDSISEGVVLFNTADLTVRRTNWPLARWLETTPHRMVGAPLMALLCECETPAGELERLLRSSAPDSLEITRQITGQQWLLSVFPIPTGGHPVEKSVLVIRDVTQERQLQQSIIDAEKRAAMIRTVSGLAQQIIPSVGYIQQQLSSIGANLEEIRSAFVDYRTALRASEIAAAQPDPAPAVPPATWETIEARHRVEFVLTDIDQALQKAALDLMRIYKPINDLENLDGPNPKMQCIDINLILENTIGFMWPDINGKFLIERSYQRNLPLVRCNQLRLQTALMNLLIYCTKQFQEKGRVKLTTQRVNSHVEVLVETVGQTPVSDLTDARDFDSVAGLIHSIIEEHDGALSLHTEAGKISAWMSLPVVSTSAA